MTVPESGLARSVSVLPSTVVTRTRLDGRNGRLPPFPSDLVEPSLDFILWQAAASHDHPGLPVYVANILKRLALGENQIGPLSNGHRAELRLLSEQRGRALRRRPQRRVCRPPRPDHRSRLVLQGKSRHTGHFGRVGAEDQTCARAIECLQNSVAQRDDIPSRRAHANPLERAAPEAAPGELRGLSGPLLHHRTREVLKLWTSAKIVQRSSAEEWLPNVHGGRVPDSSLTGRPGEIGDRPLVAAARLDIAVEMLHRLTLFNGVAESDLRRHVSGVADSNRASRAGDGVVHVT